MKYKVVFRGKVDSDLSLEDILGNVADLFDQSEEEIYQELFEKPQSKYVFIQGLSNEDAKEYQEALLEAGIMADIDLDLEFDDIDQVKAPPIVRKKASGIAESTNDKPVEIDQIFLNDVNLSIGEEDNNEIRRRFLQPQQEFTLLKDESIDELETDRIEKLKSIARRRQEEIEVDNRERFAIPPLFHSGVRIGRVRFIYRITFALALVALSLNIIPLYLINIFGDSGYYFSPLITFIAFIFTLMVVNQRFCDFSELTVAQLASIVTIFGIFVFSLFVHNYYIVQDAAVDFSKQLLNTNELGEDYFNLKDALDSHIAEQAKEVILQRIDYYVKWVTYIVVAIGSIILLVWPGARGNNHYGAPSPHIRVIETAVFVISLLCLVIGFSYPFSSKENKFENRLYKTGFYEYIGMLKPLPHEFDTIYKEYLKKNSTKRN